MHAAAGERRLRQILVETADESGFDKAAIDAVVENAQLAYYDPGETIAPAARAASLSKIVLSGVVRMMFQGERPEPMVVRFIKPGESFTSVYERGTSPAFSAVAHTSCGVALVSHEVITDAVARMDERHRAQFGRHGWTLLSDLLREKCELLTRDVKQRLLHELAILARDFGSKHPNGTLIDLALKQDDIARLVVVDRSTLNRKLKELEAAGLLHRSGGRYVLSDAAPRPTGWG